MHFRIGTAARKKSLNFCLHLSCAVKNCFHFDVFNELKQWNSCKILPHFYCHICEQKYHWTFLKQKQSDKVHLWFDNVGFFRLQKFSGFLNYTCELNSRFFSRSYEPCFFRVDIRQRVFGVGMLNINFFKLSKIDDNLLR